MPCFAISLTIFTIVEAVAVMAREGPFDLENDMTTER